eukprot:EG_transcript_15626
MPEAWWAAAVGWTSVTPDRRRDWPAAWPLLLLLAALACGLLQLIATAPSGLPPASLYQPVLLRPSGPHWNAGGYRKARAHPNTRLFSSAVEEYTVRGHRILVKRDDQLFLPQTNLSGNKARKLFALHNLSDPELPAGIVSYGGHQSNAMLALAMVAKAKGVPFRYLMKPLPAWLQVTPVGNYAHALALGMEPVPVPSDVYRAMAATRRLPPGLLPPGSLWVPQGGACPVAEPGVRQLAMEIADWARRADLGADPLCVVLPAGTGTTALFLARHLVGVAAVVAIPCVGDAAYLQQQMATLDEASGAVGTLPDVLDLPLARPFAVPDAALLEVWRTLHAAGLPVDLVYAPRAWEVLLKACDTQHPAVCGKRILYVHSGGLEGVGTML